MNGSSSSGVNACGKLLTMSLLAILIMGLIALAIFAWPYARSLYTSSIPEAESTPPAHESVDQLEGNLSPVIPTILNPVVFQHIPDEIEQRPIPDRSVEDFDRLSSVSLPILDYFAAGEELSRYELGELILPEVVSRLGDKAYFNTTDGRRQAELVHVDNLAAYWVEEGITLDRAALSGAAERLRRRYYPSLSQNFGREWRPGSDNSGPLLTVLHVMGSLDRAELGYFTDQNQYPKSVFSRSNEREMVYLNMAELQAGTPLYDGTLVHEIQHLLQWHLDANEDQWLNEGLSQVAETMAGLETVDPRPYLEQSYIRLDRWDDTPSNIYAHYGGSYLYILYLWEQLGDAALIELARHPGNGLAAVEAVLAGHKSKLSLENYTANWATTLYLDGRIADPRLNLHAHDLPQPSFSNRVRQMPYEAVSSLDQYAIDFIDLDFQGQATISFAGDTIAPLINEHTAGSFWFAPPANSTRSQLTASVDLSDLSAATLSFEVWYDLEPSYDFAYLTISTGGERYRHVLEPRNSVNGEYGPAWGGRSEDMAGQNGGWVQESIDLGAYLREQVLLRFEVLTDFEELGRGFAIRNLQISEIIEEVEWQPDGFVKTGSSLPQRWEVRLVRDGREPDVVPLFLDELNRGQVEVDLGSEGGALIVMPLTPFVGSDADYWLFVDK